MQYEPETRVVGSLPNFHLTPHTIICSVLILVHIVQLEDLRGEMRESNNKREIYLPLWSTDKML